MNRLQTELHRLYLLHDHPEPSEPVLIGPDGRVRAMVVELARQAGWNGVSTLWQGVQDELGLPEPAIAVSGIDGYQVWFSLSEPVALEQALDFLEFLRKRYLGGIDYRHITLKPATDAGEPRQAHHARMAPALQAETGRWSAFVAPGLASMFADEPWLDLAPSPDAQANLLLRLQSIKPADLQLALERLRPASTPAAHDTDTAATDTAGYGYDRPGAEPAGGGLDPKRFLLAVMNDPASEMHLRIEAAKALLPYFEGRRTG